MITQTRTNIVKYITEKGQARVHELAQILNLSTVAIHKQLHRLLEESVLEKRGKPPLVYYVLALKKEVASVRFDSEVEKVINTSYLYMSPVGQLKYGIDGFNAWATAI